MSPSSPRITIVIAAREGQTLIPALSGLEAIEAGGPRFEVLLVRGRQPSRQRNRAVASAAGEWVYFLDDDSRVASKNLARLAEVFSDPATVVVGGPNLCPDDASFLQLVFAELMGSGLVFGPSSARYRRKGARRQSSEKELILCNMAIRTEAFRNENGFDESLYPNEENALLDQLGRSGGAIVYDPDLVVYRYPRETLRQFLWMVYRYGRGRGEQVRLHPTQGSVLNFVPAFFGVYVIFLCFLGLLPPGLWVPLSLPILGYLIVACGWGFMVGKKSGAAIGWAVIPLMPMTHVIYGLGLWKGLFVGPTKVDRKMDMDEPSIERVSTF